MVEKVIWRKKALRYARETAEYLETEFSSKSAENFVESLFETIEKVKKNPTAYRKSPNTKTVHFVNVDKNRQMFYRVTGKTLIVSAFFDTRQNPRKHPF